MNFLARIKRIFLPFEFEDHPLHYNHSAEMKRKEEEDALWDELIDSDAAWQLRFTTSSDPDNTHYL